MDYLWPALLTFIFGLITYILIALSKKRRLYVVVPKVFTHSGLSDKGQAFQLVIYNRGPESEENIRVQLLKERSYTLAASTDSSVDLADNEILVSRLNGHDEMMLILLVEGGEFNDKSILKVSSDAIRGQIVETIEQVPPSFPKLAMGVVTALFATVLFMGGPAGLGYLFGEQSARHDATMARLEEQRKEAEEQHKEAQEQLAKIKAKPQVPPHLSALNWTGMEAFVASSYYNDAETKDFPIKVLNFRNHRGFAVVDIAFTNTSPHRVKYRAELISPHGTGGPEGEFGAYSDFGILVFPRQTVKRTLKVVQPSNAENRLIILEASLHYRDKLIFGLEKELEVR